MVKRELPMYGTFYIDSTVGKETSLTFSYSEYIEVRVQGPDAMYTADKYKDYFRYDEGSKVLKVILPGESSTGMWSYHVSTNATKSQITVSVQSKTRKKGIDVLQVTSWIPEQGEVEFSPKQKFGVYAEVLRGKAPVLDAQVMASIERPQSSPVDLVLYDNGVGADIIKGDGVYAANIMAKDLMGDGRYNIKVKVIGEEGKTKVVVGGTGTSSRALERQTAGQLINTETSRVENFQRVTSAGEFRLRGFSTLNKEKEQDEMPPSRITDLRVIIFDYDNFTATLQWTAVGDDMERGTASRYFIHTSGDFDQLLLDRSKATLLSKEQVLNGTLSYPQPAGVTEEIIVHLHAIRDNRTVFLSVVAIDEAGNEGDTSNLVSLSPAQETAVPRVPMSTISLKTYLAIALPLALALFVFVALGVGLLVARAKKMKSKNIEQVQNIGALSHSTHSLDMSNMNYMFEGEYRKRLQEDPDTWSRGSI
ncbi:calcium-activated chloride channel regulator 4A [Aplysia californica]|uniref:Calcium-activated chloride channel regulator 4A n=1 Tax=Aplysia californica TaxID=6500 RepID=A0ABM1VU04_APLCA|nr:calcium-activated chloride channel regulator 4A [Aplysia californica]